MINRRSLITGLISLVTAPAIVRAGSLMPVKSVLLCPEDHFSIPFDANEITFTAAPPGPIVGFVIYDERGAVLQWGMRDG